MAGRAGPVRLPERAGGVHAQLAVCVHAAARRVTVARRRPVQGRVDAGRRRWGTHIGARGIGACDQRIYRRPRRGLSLDRLPAPAGAVARARACGWSVSTAAHHVRHGCAGRRAANRSARSAGHYRPRGRAAGHAGVHRAVGDSANRAASGLDESARAARSPGGRGGFDPGTPRQSRPERRPLMGSEERLGWALAVPGLAVISAIAVFPIGWTAWESLHLHDLRMPWLGRPFVGLANYAEALSSVRFWDAMAHTAVFTSVTVTVELVGGLFLALIIDRISRGRDLVRTTVLLPWAIPTV